MSTATNMTWDIISQNLLENWYVVKIAVTEKQMEQFIGEWHVTQLRFAFMKQGGNTFTDRDWINHISKESSKTRFENCQNFCSTFSCNRAIQGHTAGDLIEPEGMGHVAILANLKQFLFNHKKFSQFEVTLGGGTFLQREKKAEKDDKLCSSLSWTAGEMRQDWVETRSRRRLLDPSCQGTGKRHHILANEIACNHCSQDRAWL